MNWLDIVIILLLLFAAWEGWREGVITQILSLAALGLGIYLAWKFGPGIGLGLGMEGMTAMIAGFAIVFVAGILAGVLVGRLTRGLFRIAGLGIFDRILGVLFSLFKGSLIIGVVLTIIITVFPNDKLFRKEAVGQSVMCRTVMKVTDFTVPYLDRFTDRIFDTDDGE